MHYSPEIVEHSRRIAAIGLWENILLLKFGTKFPNKKLNKTVRSQSLYCLEVRCFGGLFLRSHWNHSKTTGESSVKQEEFLKSLELFKWTLKRPLNDENKLTVWSSPFCRLFVYRELFRTVLLDFNSAVTAGNASQWNLSDSLERPETESRALSVWSPTVTTKQAVYNWGGWSLNKWLREWIKLLGVFNLIYLNATYCAADSFAGLKLTRPIRLACKLINSKFKLFKTWIMSRQAWNRSLCKPPFCGLLLICSSIFHNLQNSVYLTFKQ